MSDVPETIRTSDLSLGRGLLYPPELPISNTSLHYSVNILTLNQCVIYLNVIRTIKP